VAFINEGKQVASGGDDNNIRFWNTEDEAKQTRQVGGFSGPVFKLELTPDGKSLLACSSDKTVKVLDPSNGSAKQTLQGHNDWVYTFALSRDGKTLATGSWDGEVRLWNLADGKPIRTILAAPGLSVAVAEKAAAR
jgi:hypothetical protein